MCRY